MNEAPFWLADDGDRFPDPQTALKEPPGLLAAGGDLSAERLQAAYRQGIFPWFEADMPPLWWCPHPRAIMDVTDMHVPRSLRRRLNRRDYQVSMDTAFVDVISACAAPRGADGKRGTWITPEMHQAYCALHQLGLAHSVEVRVRDELIGGLYGVCIGRFFAAESMFTRADSGSKIALVHLAGQLADWHFPLLDCQIMNPHLLSLGARNMPRDMFLQHLAELVDQPPPPHPWQMRWRWS